MEQNNTVRQTAGDPAPAEKKKGGKWPVVLLAVLCAVLLLAPPVITALGGAGAFLYTQLLVPKTYKAEVKFCAGSEDTGTSYFDYDRSLAPQLVELLNVRAFYDEVATKLNSVGKKEYTGSDVQGMVEFGVVEETDIFYARVTAKDPVEAYNVAVAVAECAPQRISEMRSNDTLMVASMPIVPTSPASPSVLNNTVYGALIGAAAGAIFGILGLAAGVALILCLALPRRARPEKTPDPSLQSDK